MEIIKDPRVDVTIDDNAAFRYAAKNGHTEIIKQLWKNEAVDPFANNNQAMSWAMENNKTLIVQILKTFDPNNRNFEPPNPPEITFGSVFGVIYF